MDEVVMTVLSSAERFLQDFHQRHPGTTSAAFAHLSTPNQASSYAVLASTIPQSNTRLTVLDLACGDGYLLKVLADRQQPSMQLIGVDMSQTELDAARTTLPEEVLLLKERAQSLSTTTGSVNVVLSHLALMLMDDIEQVLAEIRRILCDDGKLAAIVGRGFLLGEVGKLYLDVFRPVAKQDALAHLPMGDPRTRTQEGWLELLSAGFTSVVFEDVDVEWHPQFNELWASLSETYDVDRLTPAAKTQLKERFRASITHLQQEDGSFPTGWGLRLIRASAS
jgi:ubiquinone/menaquinone biosynthesis C-methylase UbiE